MFELEQEINTALHDIINSWEIMFYTGYRSGKKSSIEDFSMLELHIIKEISRNGGTLTLNDLRAKLNLPNSTISSIIKRLEANGVIQRTANKSDGRKMDLIISDFGKKIDTEHDMLDIDVAHNFISRISEQDAKEFARIVKCATQTSLVSPNFSTKYRTTRKKRASELDAQDDCE